MQLLVLIEAEYIIIEHECAILSDADVPLMRIEQRVTDHAHQYGILTVINGQRKYLRHIRMVGQILVQQLQSSQ